MDVYDVSPQATRNSSHNMVDNQQGQGHHDVISDPFTGDNGEVFNSSGIGLGNMFPDVSALTSALDGDNISSGFWYGMGAHGPAEFLQFHNAVTTVASSNASVVIDGSTQVPDYPHTLLEVVLISVVVAILALVTAGGNLMVMVSFKMDKQLQTVSNYFLLSLSVADFAIGIISMPLYSLYLIMNRWPLGPIICDTWLSLDYTMSNASVANLLIISFDRYLSVTKPLSYRAKRTPKRAAIMISCAWIISAAMWSPWIFAWPYIEGKRTVAPGECEIQFLSTNQYITIITAIAAFYLPVVIMSVLYFKIYQETEKRQRDLANLQATRKIFHGHHRRTDSSDEDVYVNLRRNDSSPEFEDIDEEYHTVLKHRQKTCWQKLRGLCRIDRESDYMEDSSSSDIGSPTYQATTPSSTAHGAHGRGSVRIRDLNCHKPDALTQQNGKKHPTGRNNGHDLMIPLINVDSTKTTPAATPCTPSTEVTGTSLSHHSQMSSVIGGPVTTSCSTSRVSVCESACKDAPEQDKCAPIKDIGDIYSVLVKLPQTPSGPTAKPTIQMMSEGESEETDLPPESEGENIPMTTRTCDAGAISTDGSQSDGAPFSAEFPAVGRRFTQCSDAVRTAMQARYAMRLNQQAKSQRLRKKRQEKKQEKKAAKTLSAILLAFIITWTPYNVFTVIHVFWPDCIPPTLYAIGYWLCYINSTINPICYALCNANFRRTYWRILTCKFGTRAQPQHAVSYRDTVRDRETSYVTT